MHSDSLAQEWDLLTEYGHFSKIGQARLADSTALA